MAAVQTALGVGDDIYLFAAGFPNDGADTFSQFLSAGCNRRGGLLIAIIDDSAVLFEGTGNPAPVIKETEIPKKYAVHQKKGIFRLADLTVGAHLI